MQLQLKVNMDKSNIVVFRKGGYLAAREIWYYGNEKMSVVNVYKYLGIYFSLRISFSFACHDLVSRAKKALLNIMSKLYRINNNSLSVFSNSLMLRYSLLSSMELRYGDLRVLP